MRIADVRCHALTAPVRPGDHRTQWGDYPSISNIVVEIVSDAGLTGYGEGLVRRCPEAYRLLFDNLLRAELVGSDAFAIEAIWRRLMAKYDKKAGHMVVEAVAAIDIALWDLMGKALGQPLHRLFGGMGRTELRAYASSVSWNAEAQALAQLDAAKAAGFQMVKIKLGAPAEAAIAWAERVRRHVGDAMGLCADANEAYDLDDALRVGAALQALGFAWFEEPIACDDVEGYALLRQGLRIRLAAGEGEQTAARARRLIASRALGLIQPDCTRAAGITETRKIIALAEAHGLAYAPHLGGGGAIAAAANLHLGAAAGSFHSFECMIFPNPLRDGFAHPAVGQASGLRGGCLPVPDGPGLGIEIDPDALRRHAVR
jgi:L-alanine-DL-glutamate epimerase-like enolase superfamily enzyme